MIEYATPYPGLKKTVPCEGRNCRRRFVADTDEVRRRQRTRKPVLCSRCEPARVGWDAKAWCDRFIENIYRDDRIEQATRERISGADPARARCEGCGQIRKLETVEIEGNDYGFCTNCISVVTGRPRGEYPKVARDAPRSSGRLLLPDTRFEPRSFDFETKSIASDGRRFEGYVAVFGERARIAAHQGDFDEEVMPGAFDKYLSTRGFPVMQFDHGKDARVGSVPIGVYERFEPDRQGYFVRGKLFDNAVVEPVRQAIAGGAIKGMSWRMFVPEHGQRWQRRGGFDLRQIHEAEVPEAGPVVFPAYSGTSIKVRSRVAEMDADEIYELALELAAAA